MTSQMDRLADGWGVSQYPGFFFEKRGDKYYLDTFLIDLEQCISTWKGAKLRVNIFTTSLL